MTQASSTVATQRVASGFVMEKLTSPLNDGVYVSTTSGGPPLSAEFGGVETFNIQAFFDTGASGVLLSSQTAEFLGILPAQHNGETIVFSDVGVGGSSDFNVSNPLYFGLAPFADDAGNLDDPTDLSAYSQTYGPIRTQIGPINQTDPNPVLEGLDVFGTPFMAGKAVVMDPTPVNTFLNTMGTYVYDRTDTVNIPSTTHHVRLSHGDFERFTEVTPTGAPGPNLTTNPFIGPNPVVDDPDDDTPGVKVSLDGQSTEGSFLLDTGAAASIISSAIAADLGVTYQAGTEGTDNPVLVKDGVPLPNQFSLTIGGIGGTTKVAGFFLDEMLLRTEEGNVANDLDPDHLRFLAAPVLVGDITVVNPDDPLEQLTLDGIFGMNYLVASALVIEAQPIPIITNLTPGAFSRIVYDHDAGSLGVSLIVPEPSTLALYATVLLLGATYRRRRRA